MGRPAELEGEVFGRLKVKGLAKVRHRGTRKAYRVWHCECECGGTAIVSTKDLRRQGVRSCGCLRADRCREMAQRGGRAARERLYLGEGVAALNGLQDRYRRKARRRGFTFDLSADAFRKLVKQDCWYCGAPPSNTVVKKLSYSVETLVTNGVDRVDPTQGYTPGNTVTCCWTCNRAKGTLSLNQFHQWIRRVGARSWVTNPKWKETDEDIDLEDL